MLARVPIWGWLLLITMGLYLIYNPLGYSVWHMWTTVEIGDYLPFKVLATVLLLSVMGVIVYGTFTAMNILGLIVLVTLIVTAMWSVYAIVPFNFASVAFWEVAAQPLMGLMITVGWQWPKIWRRGHGAITVSDPDTPA
jgi:hypothetical protein